MRDSKTTAAGNNYAIELKDGDVRVVFAEGCAMHLPVNTPYRTIEAMVDEFCGPLNEEPGAATDLECTVACNTRAIGDLEDKIEALRNEYESRSRAASKVRAVHMSRIDQLEKDHCSIADRMVEHVASVDGSMRDLRSGVFWLKKRTTALEAVMSDGAKPLAELEARVAELEGSESTKPDEMCTCLRPECPVCLR